MEAISRGQCTMCGMSLQELLCTNKLSVQSVFLSYISSRLQPFSFSPLSLYSWLHLSSFICLLSSSNLLGELWRLEDDMEGEDESEHGGCTEARPRSQSPFSHFRARAAYLRKSVSADDHLDMGSDYGSGTAAEGKPSRGSKGKLKRKFVSLVSHFLFCKHFSPDLFGWIACWIFCFHVSQRRRSEFIDVHTYTHAHIWSVT